MAYQANEIYFTRRTYIYIRQKWTEKNRECIYNDHFHGWIKAKRSIDFPIRSEKLFIVVVSAKKKLLLARLQQNWFILPIDEWITKIPFHITHRHTRDFSVLSSIPIRSFRSTLKRLWNDIRALSDMKYRRMSLP